MARKNSRVVAMLGLPICNVSMRQAVASIEGRIRSGCCYQIATANLDFVRNARKNPELHKVICDCAMVLPDGFPLLLVSRILGRPLQGRITGVDLTPELAKLSAKKGYRIFLLGSSDENAQRATDILRERYPGAQFVGHYSPPSAPLEEMDDDDIVRRVREAKPDILLVAFGNPKQELWIHRNRERLQVPVSIGVGGTVDLIAGVKRRAPGFMQRLGMEWAWRMMQEPKRLAPRYFNDLVALMRYLPVEVCASWMQSRRRSDGSLRVNRREGHCVIAVQNSLTGELCSRLRDLVSEAIAANQDVTVDLFGATRIGADGVGTLLDTRRSLMSHELHLYLLGGNESIQRLLDAGSLRFMFPNDTIVARTRMRIPLMAGGLRSTRV